MATYQFLTDEWLDAARSIREAFRDRPIEALPAMRLNQIITDVPFGDGKLDAHIDTSDGDMQIELGHLPDPEVTITVPYEIAKAIFVDANAQAAMQAFMGGRIKVDGDMTKLLALQSGGVTSDPTAVEIAAQLQAITAS